jgi:hypothetical protein
VTKNEIYEGLYDIFKIIGTPKIISGDAEIIRAARPFEARKVQFYTTSPHERNKNSIVERMIRTLKNAILRYLYVKKLRRTIDFSKYIPEIGRVDGVTGMLIRICAALNTRKHRMIKAIPDEVFHGLDKNRQIIVKREYPSYEIGDFVLRIPIRRTVIEKEGKREVPLKRFDKDLEIYEVVEKKGRKYRIESLYNLISEKEPEEDPRFYEPYEVRKITDEEAYRHLSFPLVKRFYRDGLSQTCQTWLLFLFQCNQMKTMSSNKVLKRI